MRGGFSRRFFPVEVVQVPVPFLLLARDHLRLEDGFVRKERPHPGTGLFVFVHPFGDDVPGSGQGLFRCGDPLFRIDEGRGFGERVEHLFLGEDALGKGFQTLLPGRGCPRPTLGTEGEVDVLEDGEGFRGSDPAFQLIGEEFALCERFEDRLSPFVQLRELCQSVADCGDLDLVEGPRDLLPVAGDERDCPAFAEEYGRCRDLCLADGEFSSDLLIIAFRRVYHGCIVL